MKTSVGFWDALFGKKAKMELPLPNGEIKKITVTMKWLEKMKHEGKMKEISTRTVKVNILDPMAGVSINDLEDGIFNNPGNPQNDIRIEFWTIGDRIPEEQYQKFLDSETKELYAITSYDDGKPSTFLVQRSLWETTRKAMKNI
jgi:hypothetical protein